MNHLSKSFLCRLCLYKSEYLINIFEDRGKHGYVAAEVIEDLLHYNVRREDGYPQQVCTRCLDKLTDFRLFKIQCYESRVTFDKEFGDQREPVVSPFASFPSVSNGLPVSSEETVTDDYCPQKEGLGHFNVKVEKIDADEDNYDVNATDGITAEVVIKTESLDCDDTFNQNIVASEEVGDGLVSSPDSASRVLRGSEVGTIRVRDFWAASMGDGIPDMEPGIFQQGTSFPSLVQYQGHIFGNAMQGGSSAQQQCVLPIQQEEFACPQCGKRFAHLGYMNKHIRTTHNRELVERKHECEVCKMRFAKRGNLERHSMVHKGVRSFSCERCDKAFFHRSDLQAHLSSHAKVSPYTCDHCQKGFADKLHLIEHINRHTGEKPFPCPSCGKQFGSVRNLKLHEKIHEPNPTFRCEECNKTFTNRIYFLGHKRKHSGELFGCLECGKTFVHKYSLKQHEALHREDGGFACDACGKKFDKKNHLRVHTMLHTGERPFECEYCTKRFHVASHLRVHLKLHTGERSFYCDFCGKGFVQKSHYVDHVRVHTGERPFACTECNRAFCQRQQLRQHMKTHNKGARTTIRKGVTEAVG